MHEIRVEIHNCVEYPYPREGSHKLSIDLGMEPFDAPTVHLVVWDGDEDVFSAQFPVECLIDFTAAAAQMARRVDPNAV